MDEKTTIFVALGAAVGANCIPCFEHLYEKAREADLSDEEIHQAFETAVRVKNGAQITLKNAVGELTGAEQPVEAPCCGPSETCTCA